MTHPAKPFDFSGRDALLRDPEHAALYLADFLETGDLDLFCEALRHVAKAQAGGVTGVARKADLSRENLYDALSRTGNPTMETVTRTLAAMGLALSVRPMRDKTPVVTA